jgi:hypothetical protein
LSAEEYERLKSMEKNRQATMAQIFDAHKDTFSKLAQR